MAAVATTVLPSRYSWREHISNLDSESMSSTATTIASAKLNTKLVMTTSAAFMGLLGLVASFFPQEILRAVGVEPAATTVVFISIAGALYIGFALLNWMARSNAIGGIYSRPVALGNFIQFLTITLLLLKHTVTTPYTVVFGIGCAANAIFAILFGYMLFAGGDACA